MTPHHGLSQKRKQKQKQNLHNSPVCCGFSCVGVCLHHVLHCAYSKNVCLLFHTGVTCPCFAPYDMNLHASTSVHSYRSKICTQCPGMARNVSGRFWQYLPHSLTKYTWANCSVDACADQRHGPQERPSSVHNPHLQASTSRR